MTTQTDTDRNPAGSRTAMAAFAATGSSDPDVLFARKEELLAAARKMRNTATIEIIGGIALSLTIAGAIFGVPAVRRGLAARKRAAERTNAVKAAYEAYLVTAAKKRTYSRSLR